jgi:hypothetical protein
VAPLSLRQALGALAAGVAGTLAVHWLKALPWSLAAVVGLAIALLAVSSWRTALRLRRIWGGDAADRRREG